MPKRNQLISMLREIGYGELEEDDITKVTSYGYWTYQLSAPAGKVFFASGCHSLCGSADTKELAYSTIMEDIGSEGLEDCYLEDCDLC